MAIHTWLTKRNVYLFLTFTTLVGIVFILAMDFSPYLILIQILGIIPFFIVAYLYFQSADQKKPFSKATNFSCPDCKKDNFIQAMVHTYWIKNSFSSHWERWNCPQCEQILQVESKRKTWLLSLLMIPALLILISLLNHLEINSGFKIGLIAFFWICGEMSCITFFAHKYSKVGKVEKLYDVNASPLEMK